MTGVEQPPFNGFGNFNRSFKGLFSLPNYENPDYFVYRPKTAPQLAEQKRAASAAAIPTRQVDLNGCPTTTHRGNTTMRMRSTPEGFPIGAGIPKHNQDMAHNRDFDWIQSPHVSSTNLSMTEIHRTIHSPEVRGKFTSPQTWRTSGGMGAKSVRQGAPLEPGHRGLPPNFSQTEKQADRKAATREFVTLGRSLHPRPFSRSSAPRKHGDRAPGFVAGHKHFGHGSIDHQDYEKEQFRVTVGHGPGFRPLKPAPAGSWRPSKSTDRIPSTVDRSAMMQSVQSELGVSFHNTQSERALAAATRELGMRQSQSAAALPAYRPSAGQQYQQRFQQQQQQQQQQRQAEPSFAAEEGGAQEAVAVA